MSNDEPKTESFPCSSVPVFDQSLFPVFSEINRVRKDMYSDTVNGLVDKHPLELPEPIGPIVHLQEKLFVPVKEYPDVSEIAVWLLLFIANNIHAFRSDTCVWESSIEYIFKRSRKFLYYWFHYQVWGSSGWIEVQSDIQTQNLCPDLSGFSSSESYFHRKQLCVLCCQFL